MEEIDKSAPPPVSDSSGEINTYSEFMRKLQLWKEEYLRHQIAFYSSEINRLQQLVDGQQNNTQNEAVEEENTNVTVFYEYVLPPVWKRIVAEIIDFVILMLIKLYLAFMFIDFFHEFDIPDKNLDIQNYWENPSLAVQVSSEVLMLEMISRIVVCCYETCWLKGEPCATPGKRMMGLKVYRATLVIIIEEHPQVKVQAMPCSELGWKYAILRAILKNTFLGLFMFPVCLGFLFINHNRTGYDMLTNTLVVEHDPNPPRHEVPHR